jgi:hypothetical protein
MMLTSSPFRDAITSQPKMLNEVARRYTAAKLITDVCEHYDLPHAAVSAALYNLPLNMVTMLDSPQGLASLGGILAGMLGEVSTHLYQPTIH